MSQIRQSMGANMSLPGPGTRHGRFWSFWKDSEKRGRADQQHASTSLLVLCICPFNTVACFLLCCSRPFLHRLSKRPFVLHQRPDPDCQSSRPAFHDSTGPGGTKPTHTQQARCIWPSVPGVVPKETQHKHSQRARAASPAVGASCLRRVVACAQLVQLAFSGPVLANQSAFARQNRDQPLESKSHVLLFSRRVACGQFPVPIRRAIARPRRLRATSWITGSRVSLVVYFPFSNPSRFHSP